MGKKRQSKEIESKRKRAREESDAVLASGSGVFTSKQGSQTSEEPVDWENEEQDYELKPRTSKTNNNVMEGLPIKRADGKIERRVREEVKKDDEEDAVDAEMEEIDRQIQELKDQQEKEEQEEQEKTEEDPDSHLSPQEKLFKLKEEIADLASSLIEDPESNVSNLTRLRKMSSSHNPVTAQLSIMALIPVFKSLAPSYKIRPLTDAEKREKVSKEVAKMRQFEQLLVQNYTEYVDNLAKLARISFTNSTNNKKITADQVRMGQLATKAACELCLSSLRYFNYRTDVFIIIIRRLNRKPSNVDDLSVFTKCLRTIETLLKDDEENGDISFELVRILCKSVKDKKFRVDESVINIFLSLSVLHDYDPNYNKNDNTKPKLKKKDRVHISKKERKARKERKEIDEEMRKAEQALTVEEREKFQAKILKMLLTLYLEILKSGSHGEASHLMASVLEGLARFGKMANVDLLGDFLEVLREIMTDIMDNHSIFNEDGEEKEAGVDEDEEDAGMFDGRNIRNVLLCIVTAFSLFTNHSSTGRLPMSIDLTKFVTTLYRILADLSLDCDLELSHKSLRLADPLSIHSLEEKPNVNVSTKAELLLRCLDYIFFRSKNGTLPRATSFVKRLYISILESPEKTSLALLKFIGKLTTRYDEGIQGLWNTEERISGEGIYVLGTEKNVKREVELERCNSGAATLWETVILDKHYCPMVKDGARSLMKNSKPKST
ncbi:nucleolar complex-associated protein 3 [[Candida] railenensis]|uniref:Nucleolar complex-associated protein 3 n=1 Tax=[Candida] railenensis TaxID=45579 RepID=A0A9P0QW11_9ASCO|nr:nucleolar complex-associated protein 3 [[Candida] railenensis]